MKKTNKHNTHTHTHTNKQQNKTTKQHANELKNAKTIVVS